MTATITAPRVTSLATAEPAATTSSRAERLIAGFGAIGFATLVLTANAIVGPTPAFDAPASEVTKFVADKHDQLVATTVIFGLTLPMLIGFACAIGGRLRAAARREDLVFARLGVAGAILILPMFAAVVVQRIVMTVGVDAGVSPDLVTFGWRMESAAFMLNTGAIGLALIGIGVAASRSGLLPSWFRYVAVPAGVAAILHSCLSVAALDGVPVMPLGLFGFLTWMATLLTIGVRQLRAAD